MFFLVVMRKSVSDEVTFSRYAFFSRTTGEETELPSADTGPVKADQVTLVGVADLWPVPSEAGM
ncbi:MAG: hypothetical protein A2147_04275 [Chloroflexi bacterium RBG_16_57_8]|nr:MAG: hypothetical protein A2147_04275 [Chloroflexi bacterium RBG_16_57_8]